MILITSQKHTVLVVIDHNYGIIDRTVEVQGGPSCTNLLAYSVFSNQDNMIVFCCADFLAVGNDDDGVLRLQFFRTIDGRDDHGVDEYPATCFVLGFPC